VLRILAGTLLSGTLLSGPAFASSILALPPMEAEAGPSFLVIEETREIAPPIDPTVTAAYEDGQEPAVIEAPRYIAISRSISAMVPAGEPESSSIAATGESETEERETRPQRQARQVPPMVIRGGLVGEAFPAPRPTSSAPSAPSRAQQPASQEAPSASPRQPSGSGGSQPSGRQEAPSSAPRSAVPM
jgi:hypothetical protein